MAITWKTTTNLLMVILLLNLILGATASAAVISPAETNESISISKEAGTVSVQMTDGEVIYTGTDDVQAIISAVNAIEEGVILFNPGTYSVSSPIELKSNIELVGDNAVLQGYNIFTITGKTDVTIKGFEFTNPAAQYTAVAASKGLIDITNSKNCVIEDNTFRNFRDYGINVAVGSTSHSNEQITIRNNEFLDYGYCGVMIWKQSNNIYIEDNTFKNINVRKVNGNAYGIALAKGSNSYKHSEYIYIRNNWIENNPVWEGIDSHGANHVYIQDNTVINCKVPIAASYQTSEGTYPLPLHTIVITGNYVKGNMASPDKQHSGIHVLGARNNAGPHQNVTVSDNIIEDVNSWLVSDDGGIVLSDVERGVVKNNTISGVGRTGINLLNGNDLVVEENSIKNMLRISGSTLGVEMSPVAKDFSVTMKNNEFDDSVDYDAFSTPGYGNTYAVNAQEQDTSKFAATNGAMKLTATSDSSQSTAQTANNAGVTDPSISISKTDGTTTVMTGSGETVYVGDSDTEALKAAVSAVDNGTITFEQETYVISSPIALRSGIELIGNNAVITGYNIFTMTDMENVTISGFEFTNPDEEYLDRAGNNGLIYIQNSSNAFIRENTFRNFRDFGIYMATNSTSDRTHDVTIKDNEFLDYGHTGVMIGKGASNVIVENNLFRDINVKGMNPNAYGIAIMKGSSTYSYSDHIYIRNNTIGNNPTGEAIDSHGANHLYIEDNTITDSRIPMYIAHINEDNRYPVPLHHLTVTGNNIKGNFDAEEQATGIWVLGGIAGNISKSYQDVIVSGNTLEDAGNWNNGDEKAIFMENVDTPVVENNVFSGADGK